jgi:hypothetical protein
MGVPASNPRILLPFPFLSPESSSINGYQFGIEIICTSLSRYPGDSPLDLDTKRTQDPEERKTFTFNFSLIQILCWRTVPTDNRSIGEVARGSEPFMRQVFVTGDQEDLSVISRQVSSE